MRNSKDQTWHVASISILSIHPLRSKHLFGDDHFINFIAYLDSFLWWAYKTIHRWWYFWNNHPLIESEQPCRGPRIGMDCGTLVVEPNETRKLQTWLKWRRQADFKPPMQAMGKSSNAELHKWTERTPRKKTLRKCIPVLKSYNIYLSPGIANT